LKIKKYLIKNEKLIWEGQPKSSFFLPENPLMLFGFGCNVCILGLLWVYLESNSYISPVILFGFLMFLFAGVLIMIKPILDSRASVNKKYTVTSYKVTMHSKKTLDTVLYSMEDIKIISVQKNTNNAGSIYFNNLSKGSSNMESNTSFKNIENPIYVYALIRQMKNNQLSTKVDINEFKLDNFSPINNTLKNILLNNESIIWTCKPILNSNSKNKLRKKVFYTVTNLGIIIYIEKRSTYFKSILYSDLEKVELKKNEDGSGSIYFNSNLESFSYYRSRKDPFYYFKLCFYEVEDVDSVYNIILKQKELNDLQNQTYVSL